MNSEVSKKASGASVLVGVSWMALGRFASQATGFLSNVALLAFLDPADFGIMALAWTLIQVLGSLVDFGTGISVIRSKEISQPLLETAFSLSLLLAVGASAVMVAAGVLVDNIKLQDVDSHGTALVIWQLAPACFFSAFITVPSALLLRNMDLVAYSKIGMASDLTRSLSTLTLAACGVGVSSIVIGYYLGMTASLLLTIHRSRFKPRFRIHPEHRGPIAHHGIRLAAHGAVSTLMSRSDSILLTAMVGQSNLGIFSLARQLVIQPTDISGSVSSTVLLPRLARELERPRKARLTYLRADQILVGMVLPILVILTCTIEYVPSALGKPQWEGVGRVAMGLLFAAPALLLMQNPSPLMQAGGRSGMLLRWGLFRGAVSTTAFCAGSFFGLQGVAIALAVCASLALPLLLRPTQSILGLSSARTLRNVAKPLIGGGVTLTVMLITASVAKRVGLGSIAAAVTVLLVGVLAAGVVTWTANTYVSKLAKKVLRRVRSRREGGTPLSRDLDQG